MTQKGRGKGDQKGPISKEKPAGRTKRVIGIKNKVASGKYRMDPTKVADKMVEDAIRDMRARGH